MKLFAVTFFILGIFSLPLSGCMMGMRGMDHGSSHQMQGHAKTGEKEITETDARLSLDVPPVSTDKETTLVLTVSRIREGKPITGAKVIFLIERAGESGDVHAEHNFSPAVERPAEEIAGKGIYQLRYRFEEPGLYRITGEVWIDGLDASASPMTISVAQEAVVDERRNTADTTATMTVIGGIGMAIMMLLMVH